MKKTVLLLVSPLRGIRKIMVGLLVGAMAVQSVSAFDFNWGAWGRASWSPMVIQGGPDKDTEDPNDTTTNLGVGSGPAWDDLGAAVGFEVKGQNTDGTLGFAAKLRVDVNPAKNGSEAVWYPNDKTANVWAKPFSMLTLRAGLYQIDDLRGKIGGTNENFVIGNWSGDEDDIFTRFETGAFGMHLKLEPIENLQVHASVGVNDNLKQTSANAIGDIYSTGQYGVGYNIPNLLFIRAQFIGGKQNKGDYIYPNKAQYWNQIQAAFQVTAVENLSLDLGVAIPLQIKGKADDGNLNYSALASEDDTYQAPFKIALGAKYTMGDLGFLFRLKTEFASKQYNVNYENPLVKMETTRNGGLNLLAFAIEPSYKLGSIGTIRGDIGLGVKGNSKTDTNGSETDNKDGTVDLGLGVSFFKAIAGGNFSIGLATTIPVAGDGYAEDGNKVKKAQAFKFTIPIVMTYSLY
jgi:hypothetical protein